jgi:hypothetical protein
MREFVVTVIKTREEKYVIEASDADHAQLLVLNGEGDLVDTQRWTDVVGDIKLGRRSIKVES